ncbi:MAG: hypothetical protein IPK60_14405 [Sandaracinaceae bacterium]|jgi:hypothetical protein|nr:hypothetical protein [Sandaracinaceae bacterium]
MDARRKSQIKLTLALGSMLAVLGVTFVAYNIERNIRSKKTVAQSCTMIRAALATDFSMEVLRTVYESDAALVSGALHEGLDVQCNAALDNLSWYRFNMFGVVRVTRSAAREDRLMSAFDAAHTRCPETYAAALEGMPGRQSHERALEYGHTMCDRLEHNVRGIAAIPLADYGAWDWAARVNALAHDVALAQEGVSAAPSPW